MPLPTHLRNGVQKWRLTLCDKLDSMFESLMVELGAEKTEFVFYEWSLDTVAGKLRLSSSGDGIFTMFDDPPRGRKFVGCNPHSGKWNFHAFWLTQPKKDAMSPEALISQFRTALETVLPKVGS